MPKASKVELQEIVLPFSPSVIPSGISGVMGVTKRGPVGKPDILITSWESFRKLYGGLIADNDFPLLCKRALERGTTLRVNAVRHYTDPTNKSTLAATKPTIANSHIVTLSGALTAAHTMQITIGGTSRTQAFSVSSLNTLNLLAATIRKDFSAVVEDVVVVSGTQLVIAYVSGIATPTTTSTPTGVGAPTGTVSTINEFKTSANDELFELIPKYEGADYNNLIYYILPASNGNADYFNLVIRFDGEDDMTETYTNILIQGRPTAATSTYLERVVNGSQLVDVDYKDLSGIAGTSALRPVTCVIRSTGATNGGAVVDTDYLGDSGAKTGMHAFTGIDDMDQIAILDNSGVAANNGLAAYAESRKDLVAFIHIDNSFVTAQQIANQRAAMNVSTNYAAFFAGGLRITDPFTGRPKEISELGDVLGIAAYSASKFGPWFSFANTKRGTVTNALGVVNNFGADGSYNDRDLLAGYQVNIVGNTGGKTFLMGNFTAQLESNSLSFLNVRRLIVHIKKTLKPILNGFIEEPNDFQTWRQIYMSVLPRFEQWRDGRAIYDFDWQGDQDANTYEEMVVNIPADVQQGKYKIKAFVTDIVSLQQIGLDIVLTPAGVSFEDALATVTNNL